MYTVLIRGGDLLDMASRSRLKLHTELSATGRAIRTLKLDSDIVHGAKIVDEMSLDSVDCGSVICPLSLDLQHHMYFFGTFHHLTHVRI